MNTEAWVRAVRSRFSSRWDFYAVGLLCSWVLLLIPSWARLPYFMDAYYHLSVMRGFLDAGGWVGYAFWEAAPVGRPHLYPPLFHFVGCAFLGGGVSPLDVARLLEFAIYPLFLTVFWRGVRQLTGGRTAFFFLLLLVGNVPLYVYVINNAPFSLAMLLGFGAHLLCRRGRWKAAGLLIAAAFYTHTLMAILMVAALWVAGLFEGRRGFFQSSASVALGATLASPLFVHQVIFAPHYVFGRTLEFYTAQVNVVLYLLAGFGIWGLSRRFKEARYFIVLYALLTVLFFTNRDRFLTGQGVIPLYLFAACFLDGAWERWGAGARGRRWVFWVVVTGLFIGATPTLTISMPGSVVGVEVSSALRDLGGLEGVRSIKGKTLYHPRFVRELVEVVQDRTRPEEILFSNYSYAGGMVAVLAHRATSMSMLQEVHSSSSFDPVRAAHWTLWFKEAGGGGLPILNALIAHYGLVPVAETELAWLLRNPTAGSVRRVIPAVWRWPFVVICFFLGAFIWILEERAARGKVQNRG